MGSLRQQLCANLCEVFQGPRDQYRLTEQLCECVHAYTHMQTHTPSLPLLLSPCHWTSSYELWNHRHECKSRFYLGQSRFSESQFLTCKRGIPTLQEEGFGPVLGLAP